MCLCFCCCVISIMFVLFVCLFSFIYRDMCSARVSQDYCFYLFLGFYAYPRINET